MEKVSLTLITVKASPFSQTMGIQIVQWMLMLFNLQEQPSSHLPQLVAVLVLTLWTKRCWISIRSFALSLPTFKTRQVSWMHSLPTSFGNPYMSSMSSVSWSCKGVSKKRPSPSEVSWKISSLNRSNCCFNLNRTVETCRKNTRKAPNKWTLP